MVRFKADRSSGTQIDESIPLEYLLGEGYYGYFFQVGTYLVTIIFVVSGEYTRVTAY
jgi:hypothetical protein